MMNCGGMAALHIFNKSALLAGAENKKPFKAGQILPHLRRYIIKIAIQRACRSPVDRADGIGKIAAGQGKYARIAEHLDGCVPEKHF